MAANAVIFQRVKFQYFGQQPSPQTPSPPAHTNSTETNGSLLTCFNQYLWTVATVKHRERQTAALVHQQGCYKICEHASRMKLLKPDDFFLQAQHSGWDVALQHKGAQGERKTERTQLTVWHEMIRVQRPSPMFSDSSIGLAGQVVLNISQFSLRTVELLRTT